MAFVTLFYQQPSRMSFKTRQVIDVLPLFPSIWVTVSVAFIEPVTRFYVWKTEGLSIFTAIDERIGIHVPADNELSYSAF